MSKKSALLAAPLILLVILVGKIASNKYYCKKPNKHITPGVLSVEFYENANPDTATLELQKIGITPPEDILKTNKLILKTLHRNQAKFYLEKLSADTMVKEIDDRYTDNKLSQYNEMVIEDTDFLIVKLSRPITREEEIEWLNTSYPDFVDATYGKKDFRIPVINKETNKKLFSGYFDNWSLINIAQVRVPEGKEKKYCSKIKRLKSVEKVNYSMIIRFH